MVKPATNQFAGVGEGAVVRRGVLPGPEAAQVWMDFDGTLCARDVLDDLIRQYSADESWRTIEEQWQQGKIGSRDCLSAQIALLRISDERLGAFLDEIELDEGALGLIQFLKRRGVPVAVLSDGIDLFIGRILRRHGLGHLTVRSNTIVRDEMTMALCCPHSNAACASGAAHCKCASAEALGEVGRGTIYIGDGRSDLCAARRADFVFAKKTLARCLTDERIEFAPFTTLDDVQHALAGAWKGARRSVKLAVATE